VRLFVAVWPPPEVVSLLAALDRPPLDGVRWTTPDQWHVTLRFFGEVDDPEPVTALLGSLPPAVAALGPVAERPSPALLWLPVAGLDALAAAVTGATAGVGRPVEGPFRGHLTLARARRSAPREVLRGLAPLACPASWPVGEVTVVASTLGGTGSGYEVVGRVAVGA